MSKSELLGYAKFFAMVVIAIGVAATIQKRVPVVGGIVNKVMAGV